MKKKTHRQILGVGYPWFIRSTTKAGYGTIRLVSKENGNEDVELKIGELGAYKKIKLIAEYTI